ncbi:MAG TPA: dTDP-4-dehydrorhamnose 3,5-epimerase [Candidatus Binatia bacterium]|jgi:dTDP-4-dehydrorhamnose 3,5-epimerase|nr:dTDP-4-dehydrorhamnose 3,5-epimerase [Candidatus Binatia bacterium]
MRITPTAIPDVLLVEPAVHRDDRGFFLESYHAERYREQGITETFVQDNHSRSVVGTLRGLHAQRLQPQAKLVRVIQGSIFDVAVDVRRGSPTFLKWIGLELSADNARQLYVPVGFVHGFSVVTETAEVEYKCSTPYAPGDEFGIAWNDPDIGVVWNVGAPLLSPKDAKLPRVSEVYDQLPLWQPRR